MSAPRSRALKDRWIAACAGAGIRLVLAVGVVLLFAVALVVLAVCLAAAPFLLLWALAHTLWEIVMPGRFSPRSRTPPQPATQLRATPILADPTLTVPEKIRAMERELARVDEGLVVLTRAGLDPAHLATLQRARAEAQAHLDDLRRRTDRSIH